MNGIGEVILLPKMRYQGVRLFMSWEGTVQDVRLFVSCWEAKRVI